METKSSDKFKDPRIIKIICKMQEEVIRLEKATEMVKDIEN